MDQSRKIVLILGMHRSGTSMLGAGLEAMGASLGNVSKHVSDENPKGFFENEEIVAFNERLLEYLGGRWDNPLFVGSQALARQDAASLLPWYDEATQIFERNFSQDDFVAIKDPRMCQLLPFWEKVFLGSGFKQADIFYAHIVRDPIEVAKSQQKRLQVDPEFYFLGENLLETVALWFSLNYQAVLGAAAKQNLFLLYDDLLADPRAQLERIATFVGRLLPERNVDAYCDEFVDHSLKRCLQDEVSLRMLETDFPEALECYNAYKGLVREELETSTGMQKIVSLFESPGAREHLLSPLVPAFSRCISQRLHGKVNASSLLNDLRSAIDEVAQLNKALVHTQGDLEKQKQHLDAVVSSISWRITTPLRAFLMLCRGEWSKLYSAQIPLFNKLAGIRVSLENRFPLFSKLVLNTLVVPPLKLGESLLKRFLLNRLQTEALSNIEPGTHFSSFQLQPTHVLNKPLVSIIVPNYNHESYLRKRLDSIYAQDYENYEVILLDDCSSDQSLDVLREYQQRYPDKTTLIPNEKNSGGVFFQWEKGLSAASGDLVWIAESDDWCSENFLGELVPFFQDEAVMLAYCRSAFVSGSTGEQIWSIEEFLNDIDRDLWKAPFLLPAHQLVNHAWAIKNIVPNVSSAVFRNPGRFELFSENFWKQMRICGDWMFYTHLVRGGLVAYTTTATNYYRIHETNTSISTHTKDIYYQEHEMVARFVNKLYDVPVKVFERQRESLRQHWEQTRPGVSDQGLEEVYSLARIGAEAKHRKPNILMASYAFSAGGGETFPIQLANLLKAAGFGVTFLSCDQEEREQGVRAMLRPDIPVVNNFTWLNNIVSAFGIEIVHSHHAWVDNTILDILLPDSACRHVISFHGMYEMMDAENWERLLPRIIKRAAKLVYTAEKNLGPFKQLGLFDGDKFVQIDNALDVYPFTETDLAAFGIPEDAFVLCLVSRAIPGKGWREAIAAVGMARELSGRNVQLLLVGEGPEYTELKDSSPDYVHFLGFRADIRSLYAASNLGFLPSRFAGESYPLTVIDCLQAGRPVLASRIGEIPRMLDSDAGVAGSLFPLEDLTIPVDEVAEIIARYASDPEFYSKSLAAVPAAVKKFDPGFLREQYSKAYLDAVIAEVGA